MAKQTAAFRAVARRPAAAVKKVHGKPSAGAKLASSGSQRGASKDLAEERPESATEEKPLDDGPTEGVAAAVDSEALSYLELLAPIAHGLLPAESYRSQQAALRHALSGLMNGWDLRIAGRRHRLVELESYVHKQPTHADPYTHGDEGQGFCGVWYFHRQGSSFKGGSFKGLDLACGDAVAGVHAGLLIRSVSDLETGKIVEGPSLVVDHILKLNGAPSIVAFVAGRTAAQLPADCTVPELALVPAEPLRSDRLWDAPRVGLVLRGDDAGATHSSGKPSDFFARAYRFSTSPERLGKFRSGFVASARVCGDGEEELRALGFPAARLKEYMEAVDKGMHHKESQRFVDAKVATQGMLCEMVGACCAAACGPHR